MPVPRMMPTRGRVFQVLRIAATASSIWAAKCKHDAAFRATACDRARIARQFTGSGRHCQDTPDIGGASVPIEQPCFLAPRA